MKTMLIAAGLATLLLGAAPAIATPQERNPVTGGYGQGYRDDARAELDGKRFWAKKRAQAERDRAAAAKPVCRKVRRHHRWVRVCSRR